LSATEAVEIRYRHGVRLLLLPWPSCRFRASDVKDKEIRKFNESGKKEKKNLSPFLLRPSLSSSSLLSQARSA